MLPAPSAPPLLDHKRADIQVLRAWAVVLVLVFHAHLGLIPAGYLGVDIFFVVSGFLITGLIAKGIERGQFSLGAFYLRRAKRLLPAAYVVFAVTVVLGGFWLTMQEMQHLVKQLVGAVTFTANVVLWRQTGYFEGVAHLKPLLHTWSLSLEEQYYFCLPLLLVWTPRRFWRLLVLSLFVLSLFGAIWFRGREFAFYLLPLRAWELMLGSMGAIWMRESGPGPNAQRWLHRLFWPAVLAVAVVPFVGLRIDAWDAGALLVCVGTLLIILRQHPALNQTERVWLPVKVGDMSYSLYLVHWPLFALFNNAWLSGAPGTHAAWGIGLLALSFVLGYMLHIHIERPVLEWPISRNKALVYGLACSSVALVLLALGTQHLMRPGIDYTQRLQTNPGLSAACEYRTLFAPDPACTSPGPATVLLWGDSFAMHLAPGLAQQAEARGIGIVQATRSECAGLIGLATMQGGRPRRWAQDCIEFNDSVVAWLRTQPDIRTVVLSSPYGQYLDKPVMWHDPSARAEPAKLREGDIGLLLSALSKTVSFVRAMGKEVILISPTPFSGAPTGMCIERLERGLPTILDRPDCDLDFADYRQLNSKVVEFLDRAPREAGVRVLRIDGYLCKPDAGRCSVKLNEAYVYQADGAHLTYEGSRTLAERMHWLDAALPASGPAQPEQSRQP